MYADDLCLMTSSVQALRVLLGICEEYAKSHDLVFNPSKSMCQCFGAHGFFDVTPLIKLSGKILRWIDTVRYLGYDINCHNRDFEEMNRRRRELYARANLLRNRFFSCSVDVKIYLFKTFFSSIYCSSLWVPVKHAIMEKVKVAYNDAFRIIFGYSRRCSASAMFAENNMNDFCAMRRGAAYSLITRLANSDNKIISTIVNSNCFLHSSISKEWKCLLFKSY